MSPSSVSPPSSLESIQCVHTVWLDFSDDEAGVTFDVPAKAHWRIEGEFVSRFGSEDSDWWADLRMRMSMK